MARLSPFRQPREPPAPARQRSSSASPSVPVRPLTPPIPPATPSPALLRALEELLQLLCEEGDEAAVQGIDNRYARWMRQEQCGHLLDELLPSDPAQQRTVEWQRVNELLQDIRAETVMS